MPPNSNNSRSRDIWFMGFALEQARMAATLGEAPVGAIIVIENEIVSSAHNKIELDADPTAHAELLVIQAAARNIKDWRLPKATLYATLEPCVMCAAAALHARIPKVVFGANDLRWGAFGSLFDFSHDRRLNHEIEVISGVCAEESSHLLKEFFRGLRRK